MKSFRYSRALNYTAAKHVMTFGYHVPWFIREQFVFTNIDRAVVSSGESVTGSVFTVLNSIRRAFIGWCE